MLIPILSKEKRVVCVEQAKEGLEGLELISVRRKYECYQRLMESRFLK